MALRRTTLKEQVLTVLRQRLVSGELVPGRTYSATALAAHLGTSTGPVREAMLSLVQQGIMRPVPNVGFEVIPLTDEDLDEILDVRRLLEVPAVRRLAAGATPDLSAARTSAEACRDAAQVEDVTGFLAADRDFHLELLRQDGNSRLTSIVADLRDQTRLYGLHGVAGTGFLSAFAEEHLALLEAIGAGEAERAADLMDLHLAHVRKEWAGHTPGPHTALNSPALATTTHEEQ